MKGLGKILLGFAILTSVLLFYVHQRVEILRASYRIHEKSSKLSKKVEEFRHLKFDVDRMRSPELLQKRLENLSLPFTLPKQIQVIRVPDTTVQPSEANPFLPASSSGSFFDFLGQWIQIAQARTEE